MIVIMRGAVPDPTASAAVAAPAVVAAPAIVAASAAVVAPAAGAASAVVAASTASAAVAVSAAAVSTIYSTLADRILYLLHLSLLLHFPRTASFLRKAPAPLENGHLLHENLLRKPPT